MADTPTPEGPEDWRAVKIGVLLPEEPDTIGEWLAEASAFDAARAHALWIDSGPGPEWDVLALTAALSVVTFRSLLVVAAPESGAPEKLARTFATIERLSRGRLALIAEPGRSADFAGLLPGAVHFERVAEQPGTFERTGGPDEAERWAATTFPEGRQAWHVARTEAAERGLRGLVVPADPRLLDLLRNPREPGGRADLRLAQG